MPKLASKGPDLLNPGVVGFEADDFLQVVKCLLGSPEVFEIELGEVVVGPSVASVGGYGPEECVFGLSIVSLGFQQDSQIVESLSVGLLQPDCLSVGRLGLLLKALALICLTQIEVCPGVARVGGYGPAECSFGPGIVAF